MSDDNGVMMDDIFWEIENNFGNMPATIDDIQRIAYIKHDFEEIKECADTTFLDDLYEREINR